MAEGDAPNIPLALNTRYRMKAGNSACRGEYLGEGGFEMYMSERVGPHHRDEAEAEEDLDLDRTDFTWAGIDASALSSIPPRPTEPWRVGESLAECVLEDYGGASFPHPYSRDQRNPFASPSGPDLAGYYAGSGEATFLFGEVKTTSDEARPPGVVASLRRQMEMLRPGGERAAFLMKWLMDKERYAGGAQGERRFREAFKAYVDCRWTIAGVLISDRAPDKRDLDAAFARLSAGGGPGERLDLVALYVPVPVGSFPDLIKGGGAA